ncbi:hypothetical protein FRC03_011077 [Tulasnella sp. 419]|nr:hypothetical protein FRC03_011077 [Tulasnella sp. 419]
MDPSCQAEACSLQTCLNKNTYSPEKCDDKVMRLYQCCMNMYKQGSEATSTACPKREVVERRLAKKGKR